MLSLRMRVINFSPILSGNEQDGIFAIYADQGSGSIDLVVQKFNSNFEPVMVNVSLFSLKVTPP